MSLSESERRVLDDLEQQLHPAMSTRTVFGLTRLTRLKQILVGSAAVSAGLVAVGVALALTGAARIVLELMAYLLVVGGSAVVVDCTSRWRRATGRPAARFNTRPTRYFR